MKRSLKGILKLPEKSEYREEYRLQIKVGSVSDEFLRRHDQHIEDIVNMYCRRHEVNFYFIDMSYFTGGSYSWMTHDASSVIFADDPIGTRGYARGLPQEWLGKAFVKHNGIRVLL